MSDLFVVCNENGVKHSLTKYSGGGDWAVGLGDLYESICWTVCGIIIAAKLTALRLSLGGRGVTGLNKGRAALGLRDCWTVRALTISSSTSMLVRSALLFLDIIN